MNKEPVELNWKDLVIIALIGYAAAVELYGVSIIFLFIYIAINIFVFRR